jgi:hydrogenase maturation protein HypF
MVSPDLDCCADCLAEIEDPQDRRYGYPFTNCTNCGPRYTLIESLPYDRPATTMGRFNMCLDCRKEYENPANRRFHAQPNACSRCGPNISMPLELALEALRAGEILAIKGVGGYHLACDAGQAEAIATLRQRKGRPGKPFAVMVDSLERAAQLAELGPVEAKLLSSRPKPIVILRCRGVLPATVAPQTGTIGLMLPYSPLHYLLFSRGGFSALVMTSANLCGQPIVTSRVDAQRALKGLADRFLHHDRRIHTACDDSVVRVFRDQPLPLRRSRGYAPYPVRLPFPVADGIATGGQLKSAFCLGKGRQAFLSQHLGDLENLETWQHFQKALDQLSKLYELRPKLICIDAHPGYLSSRWASQGDLPVVKVQHHHAHIASLMAEHGLPREARVLGLVFDGTGYGDDGTIWGGELLEAGYDSFHRRAWLHPVPLPGADNAVREPWRMALSHLWAAGLDWSTDLAPVAHAGAGALPVLKRQLERSLATVPTSSMGRLFDAVAAVIGLRQVVDYEAQAAIQLEAVADPKETGSYQFGPSFQAGPVWTELVHDLRRGLSPARISMRFHRAVARVAVRLCQEHDSGLPVALSGGVFQNVLLLELVTGGLEKAGFTVLRHRLVPPNDGGLALGQLVVGHCLASQREALSCV